MPHLLCPQIEGGQFAGIAMERVNAVFHRKEQSAIPIEFVIAPPLDRSQARHAAAFADSG
jgi:hypothetical protein